ncbi:MAG TPA: DUF4157 domain-containing protein [Bacteroidia bacterium]|jgi:hypothetical protein|nr:DUF4157 domain-containing protein [Bacteroidia bacterium]
MQKADSITNKATNIGSQKILFIQPKLSINTPGDSYEQEADAMADKVMRMNIPSNNDLFFKPANPFIQRKCAACAEEDKQLHRKENSASEVQGNTELDNYVSSLNSSGQSLPESSRQFFEPRFGQDFSNVKVHTDSVAAKSAQSINALAYTTGNNIVFNSGQYSPNSESGQKLMAHELTHVVQQKPIIQRQNIPSPGNTQVPTAPPAPCSTPQVSLGTIANIYFNSNTGQTQFARCQEAINRMLNTAQGQQLVNELCRMPANRLGPGQKKINISFTDNLSCGEPGATGCFQPSTQNSYPYSVYVQNIIPSNTNSRTLFGEWGGAPNTIRWSHTDPESKMANTLFHELLHVWFLNTHRNALYPTGHGNAYAAQPEIEPDFEARYRLFCSQLDAVERQSHGSQYP